MTVPPQEMHEIIDGPCGPWPIDPKCCPDWPPNEAEWTDEHWEAAYIATDILWRLTAGRYGLCEEWLRPCRQGCLPDGGTGFYPGYGFVWGGSPQGPGGRNGWMLNPYQDSGGRWFNFGCGCGTDCSCEPLCAVELPGPAWKVTEVRIDGAVVDPATYTLDRKPGKDNLLRVGGECWPTCQTLTLPDTEPGTFSVRYLRGKPVPPAGVRAVSMLACEVFKECHGSGGCLLPQGVKTVQREGVTYDILPPGDWMETLRQNLSPVFRWVQMVNPYMLKQPSAVFSLDLPAAPRSRRMGPGWGQ